MFGVNIVVFLSVTISLSATAVQQLRSDGGGVGCWKTRCQGDSWPDKGCNHYGGMTETKRVPCDSSGDGVSGHVYTCCRSANTSEPQNNNNNNDSCDGGTVECRPTVDGCRVYNTTGAKSSCANGYQYVCCEHDDRDDEDDNYGKPKKGKMTFFHLGKTAACGKTYYDKDMVGAVGPAYFSKSNPNKDPVCGKKVKIVDPVTPSKSVVVRIVDKCGGCSKYDISVSPAAFIKIKPLRVSVTEVKWAFVS